jgi:signal transduction histidine kinase
MEAKLKILHLEDSPADCELVQHLLLSDGIHCNIERCDSRQNFIRNLEGGQFDLIFADCTLPQFNGVHALELAREMAPTVPFIFVSGTIEEDLAIESLRGGATDYVLKTRLSRLVPAVRRALAEAAERAKNQEMEQRLRQSQRLESVGTLAGGIAHDFNNILTIIKGYTTLLPMESGNPDRVREIALTIDRASQRGSEMVSQLLAFARKSEGMFTSTEMNRRVRDIVTLLRPSMPANVDFELHLDDRLPEIHADQGQVERVLINLCTNARDAMPDGGKISFETSRVQGDQAPLQSGSETDEYLCLRVTDTGCGMDEATRQRIFEPFFTTKPRGKGTGLGMPVVYGLMQSHNGLIDVQSEPGKGTSISLYFPIPTQPMAQPAPLAPASPAHVAGTETVVIADDEPDVRYFLEVILRANGYTVYSAATAPAALALVPLPSGEVHLLLSDIGLPGMDGFELSRRMRRIQPGVKTILCSGFSDGGLKTKMAEEGIDAFIPKPYDMAELLHVIRTILDKKER